jgi:hypothetical protein
MWWRVLIAAVLPPALVSVGVASRYWFGWRSEAIDPSALVLAVLVGAILLWPLFLRRVTRWWVLVGYAFASFVVSFIVALSTACNFGDCV